MSPSTSIDAHASAGTFATLPRNAAAHFKLCFLGAVLHVVDQLAHNLGGLDEVIEQFPFLRAYLDELETLGATPTTPAHDWLARVRQWELGVDAHLPIRALRHALDLDDRDLTLLFAIGLIEEDPRFGFVIECAQPVTPQQHRPTLGLLTAWWRGGDDVAPVRECIRVLLDNGLIQVINADAPRLQWVFQSLPAVWDAIRGDILRAPAPGLTYIPPHELGSLDALVLPANTRRAAAAAPALLASGDVRAFIVRGPRHNGRRTLVRAIAAALGRGVLELRGPLRLDDARVAIAGALATLAHAIPMLVLDLGLGETADVPPLRGYDGPIAVVLGKHGAVSGRAVDGAITINVDMPDAHERRALWEQSVDAHDAEDVEHLARRFRMTSGNIRSAAALARSYALLDERTRITPDDVRVAGRSMHRELETLATLLPASGGWESIGASESTLGELRNLETRCRNREALREHVGRALARQLNCGVRALFAGPSGTGKTMAARILASTLQMDLYRLDLASVVNKYIGETEKSLDQLFSRAEELDVVLLLDEGDALLTSRTAVQSSNDRYANLETNFLLQRLESFEGVLVVTTNAANRIDSAFQRRMDVVVDFHMPDPHDRWTIWQLHLPLEHDVEHAWLQDAAVRCELTGGQIRNAVLHASLLALDDGRRVATRDVASGLQREYRKSGAVCPLPPGT
ncbi:MAG: ATP-binding protein [Acidobacteria bacterium]|nr:ATP-binding protein [Acidobacteriota bacterium]MBV9478963.1 ATP-binding protein [Acidobacteriota bacterium]